VSLADAHLGRHVGAMAWETTFVFGLLGSCVSSWGMLAGLQRSGPGGPTAHEVAEVLRDLVGHPRVGALGISSFPTAEEGRATSMRSAMTLVRAALEGLAGR
jgi:hypothetical protein